MSESLPERPDLDQLRRQAKALRDAARRGDAAALERCRRHHPTTGQGHVTLAAAQLVIARELGFTSWPRLKAAVDAELAGQNELSALLGAALNGHWRDVYEVLRREPGIARRDVRAASVLGEPDAVRARLAADQSAAVGIDQERGWPPLLYACYSRWHQIHPDRGSALAEVARLLLRAGASPNTNDGGRPRYRSALKGSVEVNNPDVAEVLLAAGADPDPGEPIVEAIAHRDHRCLRLLLAYGARVERTWALGAAVYNDDAAAMSLLLAALQRAGAPLREIASGVLGEAAGSASLPLVAALLDAGADPDAKDDDGMSAVRRAVRAGNVDAAHRLRELGATDDSTDVDRFLGACLTADRGAAERLLGESPDLRDRLSDDDRAVIVDAAATGSAEAVALMLDVGFSASARKFGDQPLHNAAYHGNAAVVRLLLDRGVDVDARDDRFDSTALAFASVGSGEQAGRPGDWIETVKLLLEAGASRDDVWIAEKPPSDEVAELLRRYGVGPEEPEAEDPGDGAEAQGSLGTGIMAEIARHLEAAYRDLDLELLGSLLHSDVRWTGDCTNRAQVLDWYRALLAEGTVATVESLEVDGDAVLVGLSVSRSADGARPAPPERLHQVFTVVDAQIVDIRGYPDRASALARQ